VQGEWGGANGLARREELKPEKKSGEKGPIVDYYPALKIQAERKWGTDGGERGDFDRSPLGRKKKKKEKKTKKKKKKKKLGRHHPSFFLEGQKEGCVVSLIKRERAL